MHEHKKAYRHIFKATSIFGGAQVIQILATLVRAKFIAVILGPVGMGMSGLFLSGINIIGNITSLGLNFSAVREISQASETNDLVKISRTIKVFRRWGWFSGLLGMIVTICAAPFLSRVSFGNNSYVLAFICLSSILLLNALASSNVALLQGMRRIKQTAKSTVIGSIIGLFASIPLFYFYGYNGIVPSLIVAAATSLVSSWYFAKNINQLPSVVSYKDTYKEGREMAKLGIVMMTSVFLGAIATYTVNAFISYKGGVNDVGLYQAGLSITNQFIGLVFVAMGTDFFPRLSAISSDNQKIREMVNHQAEIVVLIVSQLLVALIITAPLIIHLLLSPDFYSITGFVRWTALGMLFKAASYAVGYISFAKGDKKVFFLLEGVMSNCLSLILNVIAYNYWGLTGIGISFLASYIIYFITVLVVTKRLYSFNFATPFFKIFFTSLMLCTTVFLLTTLASTTFIYLIGGVIFIISLLFTLREVDNRIGIKSLLVSRLKK